MSIANKYNRDMRIKTLTLFSWLVVFLAVSLFSQTTSAELFDDLVCQDSEIRQKAFYRFDSSDAGLKENITRRLIERSYSSANQPDDQALKVLINIGASAISPAIKVIEDVTFAERNPWVDICLNAGKGAIPELRKFLTSDRVHSAAAASLMLKIDPENDEAASHISRILKASNEEKMTIFCLRALSTAAKPTAPEIQTVIIRLENPGSIRDAALNCLNKFGSRASASAADVLKVLKTESKEGRIIPLKVLGNLGESSFEAVPYLCELAANEDIVLRLNVLRVIGEIGVDPARSVPVLEASLSHEDEFVRAAAAEALGRFDRKAYLSVQALSKALMSSKLNYTQDKIVQALRAIGTADALAAVDKFRKEIRQKKK